MELLRSYHPPEKLICGEKSPSPDSDQDVIPPPSTPTFGLRDDLSQFSTVDLIFLWFVIIDHGVGTVDVEPIAVSFFRRNMRVCASLVGGLVS